MLESFDGKVPQVSTEAFVHKTACVSGDVTIAGLSLVLPGVVITGNNGPIKIGTRTIIEENCVLHVGTFADWEKGIPSQMNIGERVIIGHGAVVHAKAVGDRVLIGINATLLEGVEVGDECIIAAGAVVPEGLLIPNRSFVAGVPAKIKSKIKDSQMHWIKDGAKLNDDYFIELIQKMRAAYVV